MTDNCADTQESFEASSPMYEPESFQSSSPTQGHEAYNTSDAHQEHSSTDNNHESPRESSPTYGSISYQEEPHQKMETSPQNNWTSSSPPRRSGHRYNQREERRGPRPNQIRTRSFEVVNALRKAPKSVSEGRLADWFPDIKDIHATLIRCRNVRFIRDDQGTRRWEYESDRRIQNDVYDAVNDGCSRLEDVQRRVRRRFVVVRNALSVLERSKRIYCSTNNTGDQSWKSNRQ
jgi:hypothetical protein